MAKDLDQANPEDDINTGGSEWATHCKSQCLNLQSLMQRELLVYIACATLWHT